MTRRNLAKKRKNGAFTLMEILVALAIFALGLSVVTTLTTTTARQAERVEEETAVQNACQNLMNSILAGDAVVSIGEEIPIPDAPNWTAIVELLDGPIESVVAVRVVARRFATVEVPSPTNPNVSIVSREPDPGRMLTFKEWARRADVRLRTLRRNLDGTVSALDANAPENASGVDSLDAQGSLGAFGVPNAAADPFAAIDAANGVSNDFFPDRPREFPNGAAPIDANGSVFP